MSSKMIGDITELEVMTYVTRLGIIVSTPFGDRARYDQIWDYDGILIKVQVKTAISHDDGESIEIYCRSNTKIGGKIRYSSYTENEIDCIATYWNNRCYVIPVKECGSTMKKLRFSEARNGQIKDVTFAKYYTVEEVLKRVRK